MEEKQYNPAPNLLTPDESGLPADTDILGGEVCVLSYIADSILTAWKGTGNRGFPGKQHASDNIRLSAEEHAAQTLCLAQKLS